MQRLLVAAIVISACTSKSSEPAQPTDVIDCPPTIIVASDGGSPCTNGHGICVPNGGSCAPDGVAAGCPSGYTPGGSGAAVCNSSDEMCCVPVHDGAPADGSGADGASEGGEAGGADLDAPPG
jgi:hypothetical protein